MQFRLTAALVAVFALLAGVVSYFDLTEPAPSTTPTVQVTVLDIPAADVARVEVSEAGKSAVVERADDGSWRITAPTGGPADTRRVEDAVGRVARLNATRTIDGAGDLTAYGLVDPAGRVSLRLKDGTARELLLGSTTPDNTSRYVTRAEAGPVYIVPSSALADLSRWASDPPRPRPTPTPLASPPAAPSPAGTGAPASP